MKIEDLNEDLKRTFTTATGYGVTKLKGVSKEWTNIYFVVPKAPPREIKSKLPHALLSEALRVIGALPRVDEMSKLDKLINYLFVRREVVQSSRLEGTWSTIDHALTPGNIAEENHGKSEHQAVRSYANLIEEIVKQTVFKKESIFTKKFICNIQKKIVTNDPQSIGIPGKLRIHGKPGAIVTIGGAFRKEGSTYNPAPATEVQRCLEEVLTWLRDDKFAQQGDAAAGGLSLPIRLAIGHVHFEAVHPFTDGNGRVGRALWPVQMVCSGHMPLYLSGYVEIYKKEYFEALAEAQKQLNYIPIIEFICRAIIESNFENQKTKEAIKKLEQNWQARGKFRLNSGPRRSLFLLLTKPIITTNLLAEELGVSKTASLDTINALLKKNIIKYRKTENRKRIYAAEELIQVLARPFGEDIEIAIERAHILLGLKA